MRPRSIAGRVAWLAGGSIALSGVIVALATGAMVVRLFDAQEDSRLRDAARTLAFELSEPNADPIWIAADEAREIEHTGMHVAVYEGQTFVSGDRRIGFVAAGDCRDLATLRACGVASSRGLVGVVARGRTTQNDLPWLLTIAAVTAVLVTSMLGALAARTLARWSVAPLVELRDAVERVPLDAPERADLGPDRGIAELDALRTSLRSALDRLGAALGQSRRFSSDAAHELRTPLTTILGELELAKERVEDLEAVGSIARARATGLRLSTLVERLLVLATPAAGLESVEHISARDLVEDACIVLPIEMRDRLRLELIDVELRGDSALLAAMLTNAIENALKFSEAAVVVTLSEDAENVVITVDDEGRGISEAERDRVFLPFYRTPESRAGGPRGHGIGLALIAHVVDLHGGAARFVDRPIGARLQISLRKSIRDR